MNSTIWPRPLVEALIGLEIAEHERPLAAHFFGIAVHDFERCAEHGREIDFVDYQQIGFGDAGPALARDLVAGGDVDHVEREIGEFGAECRGEVVAAALYENDPLGKRGGQSMREPESRTTFEYFLISSFI